MSKKQVLAENRRVTTFEIPKEDLLKILQNEAFAPIAATRIVATGHRPDVLTVTVAYD